MAVKGLKWSDFDVFHTFPLGFCPHYIITVHLDQYVAFERASSLKKHEDRIAHKIRKDICVALGAYVS